MFRLNILTGLRVIAYFSAAVSIALAEYYPPTTSLPTSNQPGAIGYESGSNVVLSPSRRQRGGFLPFKANSVPSQNNSDAYPTSPNIELDSQSLSPTLVNEAAKDAR